MLHHPARVYMRLPMYKTVDRLAPEVLNLLLCNDNVVSGPYTIVSFYKRYLLWVSTRWYSNDRFDYNI
jgi:hypothetical protein